jgi:spore coat protein A
MNFVGPDEVDPANPGGALLTAPAERWDVVVDFNGKGGKKYVLVNDAPAPFPMGDSVNDYPQIDPVKGTVIGDTTVLMRFEVKANSPAIPADARFLITPNTPLAANPLALIDAPLAGQKANAQASGLNWSNATTKALPVPTRPGVTVRQLTANEVFDAYGRLIQMMGTNVSTSPGDFSREYMDPATETPPAGATEVRQIVNLTGDVHPVHFHLVNAQLLSRQPIDPVAYADVKPGPKGKLITTGPARGPLPTELGWKETFKMNPGEVTTIIMKFDLPWVPFYVPTSPRTGGYEYVWHCHILEHEEHDMMRPA